MPHKSTIIYFDNDWLETSQLNTNFFDHAMRFGYGVVEEMRCYLSDTGINIFKAKEHFMRLIEAAKRAKIECNYSIDDLVRITHKLLDINNLENAHIRAIAYENEGEGKLMISVRQASGFVASELVEVKSAAIIGTNSTSMRTLLIDKEGYVIGGQSANFFFIKDEVLYTPLLNDAVFPGLMRDSIIECAMALGYPVIEKSLTPNEINGSEAAFFSNASYEMSFVAKFNDYSFTTDWRNTMAYDLVLLLRQQTINTNSGDLTII